MGFCLPCGTAQGCSLRSVWPGSFAFDVHKAATAEDEEQETQRESLTRAVQIEEWEGWQLLRLYLLRVWMFGGLDDWRRLWWYRTTWLHIVFRCCNMPVAGARYFRGNQSAIGV